MSNSLLNRLKSAIKNGTKVILNIWPNVVGDSNDDNSFPRKLLLINTQVSKLRKDFSKNSAANIKSLKL